jgi:hypothetical protein
MLCLDEEMGSRLWNQGVGERMPSLLPNIINDPHLQSHAIATE